MKISLSNLLAIILIIAVGIYFIAQTEHEHKKTITENIRIGVLPDENSENIQLIYKPLLDHLAIKTGINCQLIIPANYNELVQLFGDHKVDMAYFGGVTFVQANIAYDAQPLVMRDIDTRFTSYFLVRNNNLLKDISAFNGKVFSFGSQLSTSGHLMPRHFLKLQKQIIPEEFFSEVRYSGAHDTTAYQVRDGDVDLGVANSVIINSMFKDGRLKNNDLHILWETPPYPDYVWAVQGNMDENIKTQLRDAFLELDSNNVIHNKILEKMGANAFLPAGISEFQPLKKIIDLMDLSGYKAK